MWRDGVLGFRSAEELVAGTLVLVAPIAAAFAMAPFPLPYLSPIAITPVAVLLADTVYKLLIRSHAAGDNSRQRLQRRCTGREIE